jgi:hypothetical protein
MHTVVLTPLRNTHTTLPLPQAPSSIPTTPIRPHRTPIRIPARRPSIPPRRPPQRAHLLIVLAPQIPRATLRRSRGSRGLRGAEEAGAGEEGLDEGSETGHCCGGHAQTGFDGRPDGDVDVGVEEVGGLS